MKYQYFTDYFLCSFICLQAVFQFSRPMCKSTWRYISLLTFISCFMIDFLSIEKGSFSPRLLPTIVTPYSHFLYTKMQHFAWQFIPAILSNRGGSALVYILQCDLLPVIQTSCRVRR